MAKVFQYYTTEKFILENGKIHSVKQISENSPVFFCFKLFARVEHVEKDIWSRSFSRWRATVRSQEFWCADIDNVTHPLLSSNVG